MMFTTKFNINLLKVVHNITNQSFRNARFKRNNPGVDHRLKLVQSRKETENDFDVEELEADFMNIDKSHIEHEKEIETLKEQVKLQIIKQKYFKEKYPNFLTWSDKEQIRFLYNKDPEEWSIEKLSEGFPATPDIIKLIVKSKWMPKSESKIKNHDASVAKNWKQFKEGKLELPDDIQMHIERFSMRQKSTKMPTMSEFNNTEIKHLTVTNENINLNGEFASIISSFYKKPAENPFVITQSTKNLRKPTDKDTYIIGSADFKENQYVTLETLKTQLEKKFKGKSIEAEDELILNKLSKDDNSTAEAVKPVDLPVLKREQNKVKVVAEKTPVGPSYPETINIPKKFYKRGHTYKVDDCYYDSDGIFLYRVPGMSN